LNPVLSIHQNLVSILRNSLHIKTF
jgi:hypothetical protein